jgi:hypothetical protein
MTTLILLVCSIFAAILAWRFRQCLAPYLPPRETMTTAILVGSIVLLAILALLPEILSLVSTMKLLPPIVKIVLVLAAAVVASIGCSKKPEAAKPDPIHWRGPETGYHAESTPRNNTDKPKEGP